MDFDTDVYQSTECHKCTDPDREENDQGMLFDALERFPKCPRCGTLLHVMSLHVNCWCDPEVEMVDCDDGTQVELIIHRYVH